MDYSEILDFLNQKMQELRNFRGLAINNNEFPRWCTTIELYLFKVFGEDSIEYKTFKESGISHGAVEEEWREYYKALDRREVALASIIDTVKMMSDSEVSEKNGLPTSTVEIFDAMQFHPKIIEASRSYFISGNYRGAVLDAFIALIDYVKEKTKLTADTKDLMAKAFDPNRPVIKLNNLEEQYERDEQEGFRFLYMGASVGIRNPKVHKLIPQSNPLHTLEYLAFASLLFRRIDEGTITRQEGAS